MAKIIDSFLFFQELDLLEIRLEYLYDKVDNFIILEACQTFTGKAKPFNFENNKDRFEKYLDKIIYFKIEDFHDSYESVINFLKSKNDEVYTKASNMLESHTHYPKDGLHWVLDDYHRESLHIAYAQYAEDDDIVFLSDLDEIPTQTIFDDSKLLNSNKPIVCKQHEFMYFLNYYNNSEWLGTIFSKYSTIKNTSLNNLRIDSKVTRNIVDKKEYDNGGYHFTSVGSIEDIKKKIQSWGHQEFNTKGILDRIEYNINTGQDIFEREYGTEMAKIEFTDIKIFDERIVKIILKYDDLLAKNNIIFVNKYSIYNIFRKIRRGSVRRFG
jgi:beta-1,4-mannosyl-glycoprotein beta-1,4-N-acetylglucosaminyltransferase